MRRKKQGIKSHWLLWLVIGIILFITGLAVFGMWQQQLRDKADHYKILADREKAWILQCQEPNGLILYKEWHEDGNPEEQTVVPYFSTIAAFGLLAGTVTEEQAQGAQHYINWYLDHLNAAEEDPVNGDGTIYDYIVSTEAGTVSEQNSGKYDSVDSYAALFLLLADRFVSVEGGQTLAERNTDILRVADALLRTIQANGLSIVKAEYPVQYLMDNAEVYAGLDAGAHLLRQIAPYLDELEKNLALQKADDMIQTKEVLGAAFENLLWNAENRYCEVGLMEGKKILDCAPWEKFYPDSVGQLFPICFGLLPAKDPRSEQLYEAFCDAWNWESFEHWKSDEADFYWCAIAYAASVLEDDERILSFMEEYRKVLAQNGRGYPLYTGDAGWLALACGHMEDVYRDKILFGR